MGGIDEAALNCLSLVTDITKHIRVRDSKGQTTVVDIRHFSPHFVWLLRVSEMLIFLKILGKALIYTEMMLKIQSHLTCVTDVIIPRDDGSPI